MKTEIIIFGKNIEIIEVVERIINKNMDWNAFSTSDLKQVFNKLTSENFDILLLSSGISNDEFEEIESFCAKNCENTILLHHYGGGGGLLKAGIEMSIQKNNPIGRISHNRI